MPLPAMKTARRCRARAKSTQKQCANPAAFGCRTCRVHGARRAQTIKRGEQHWNYQHGQQTQEMKAAGHTEMQLLLALKALMILTSQIN